ncbi:1, 2-alpha-mannosidase [Aspergillus ambiguus]|uniref:glycoside hydrolase family 47 protein n=1 Tax=Aspergillus ambiguus TaxID=176160 RepID=UPI003CCDD8AE
MLCVRKSYAIPTAILICLTYLLFSSLPPGAERSSLDDLTLYSDTKETTDDNRPHFVKHTEKHPVSKYIPLPNGAPSPIPRIQNEFPPESWWTRRTRVKRQQTVKEAFKHAWKGYRKYAWMHDELSPLSGGNRETFAGWAATLVDSLDSLIIMGLTEEFEEALKAIEHIDFSTTHATQINIFETTIRYLGGFLGAYDLTNGTYPVLLKKATEIADMVYASFDTENRMPQSRWDWTRSAEGLNINPSKNTIMAELGSLNLEFTRMSQLTGDNKYFDAVQRITEFLEDSQKKTRMPGLWPLMVNAEDMTFPDPRFSIGGMADSTYEYLPKEHMLLGAQTKQYRNMYDAAMDPIKKRLLFRAMTKDKKDVYFAGNMRAQFTYSRETLEPQVEHLKCFLGGTVGIGAKVFDRPDELSIARKLTDGCIWAYDIMPTGIMPEVLYVSPCKELDECEWDEEKWYKDIVGRSAKSTQSDDLKAEAMEVIKKRGLPPGVTQISDAQYKLRPEAIESVFIMYRITGDKELQDAAWRMFRSIEKITRTDYAHAAIDDVRNPKSPQLDYMESFWLAETLKYFYLIFSEPDLVNLDEYVLNTEAHPFKRPTA